MKVSPWAIAAGGAAIFLISLASRKTKKAKKRTGMKSVVETAQIEKDLWDLRDEETDFGRERVARYWTEGVGVAAQPVSVPWSGAFIAWVTHTAAPGSLPRSGKHSIYAKHSINAPRGKYSAYPASLIKEPRPGDILIKPRPGEVRSFGELHADAEDSIPSHADIITAVLPDRVIAIGGNKTGNTVREESYARLADGSLAPPVFAVLTRSPVEYYAHPDGWRRARNDEVTDDARQDAKAAVKTLTLGEVLYGDGYLIAVETHEDERRGKHRGASVFVPDERIS